MKSTNPYIFNIIGSPCVLFINIFILSVEKTCSFFIFTSIDVMEIQWISAIMCKFIYIFLLTLYFEFKNFSIFQRKSITYGNISCQKYHKDFSWQTKIYITTEIYINNLEVSECNPSVYLGNIKYGISLLFNNLN